MVPRLFVVLGLMLTAVGGGMLSLPQLTRRLLLVIGVRWDQGPYRRAAAWMLVVLGLVIAFLGRVLK